MKHLVNKSDIEWTDLACNFYFGCAHACRYNPVGIVSYGCYAQALAWRWRMPNWETWAHPTPTTTLQELIERLPKELAKIPAGKRILLSSMTDPYQPLEDVFLLTRTALQALVRSDKHIIVLTKSDLVLRDMELFAQRPNVEVGITLTCSDSMAVKYEPGSPPPLRRIAALATLAEHQVNTFVSIEPWLPGVTDPIDLIKKTWFNKKVILGSLNHAGVDKSWYITELPKVEAYCAAHGIELLVKKELRKSCSGAAAVQKVKACVF